jgi:hypothetical protein
MASRSCCLLLALLLGLHASGCATEPTTIDVHDRVDALETHHRGDVPSFVASDVVIVIDQSSLTLLASGVDVDKDGIVGRNPSTAKHAERTAIPAEQWTTDSDDTVEALELEVARALIPRLASRNNRLGLASFTLRARTEGSSLVRFNDKPLTIVPIGPPDAVLAALANFPSARERRHIDLARLLELAIQILEEAPITEPERPRVILLLSAGEPSAPDGIHWSTQRAIGFVDELVDRRITLWAIPFGFADVAYLPDLTRPTGGDVLALEELDALFGPPASRARSAEHETDG